MTVAALPFDNDTLAELVATASRPGFARWQEMIRQTGGCAEPIHLFGGCRTVDGASGEVLTEYDTQVEPGGKLLVACHNRRASRCPSCAEVYRADTYQLIRAGLVGGKGVPETVVGHPRVFATFTAPSFGAVHHRVEGPDGRIRRCHPELGCRRRHRDTDPELGQAINRASYDYVGAVIWNAMAGTLWRRTQTVIVRQLASRLGVREGEFRKLCRVSFGKVAEFQVRGVVHFHAIVRLDGPEGATEEPAAELTVETLIEAVRAAAGRAVVVSPGARVTGGARECRWGAQIDVQAVTGTDAAEGDLSDEEVAGYVAKYATKGAECSGTLDRPIACWRCKGSGEDPEELGWCRRCDGNGTQMDVHHLIGVTPHAQAMISTCWDLGACAGLEELRLRPWAHMLGFRGHFSTKSRRYSTTLGALRGARKIWRHERLLASLGRVKRRVEWDVDDGLVVTEEQDPIEDESVLVVGEWRYIGRGHSPGEAVFAATIADDLATSRRLWRRQAAEEDAA